MEQLVKLVVDVNMVFSDNFKSFEILQLLLEQCLIFLFEPAVHVLNAQEQFFELLVERRSERHFFSNLREYFYVALKCFVPPVGISGQ